MTFKLKKISNKRFKSKTSFDYQNVNIWAYSIANCIPILSHFAVACLNLFPDHAITRLHVSTFTTEILADDSSLWHFHKTGIALFSPILSCFYSKIKTVHFRYQTQIYLIRSNSIFAHSKSEFHKQSHYCKIYISNPSLPFTAIDCWCFNFWQTIMLLK